MIGAILIDDEKKCLESLEKDLLKYCPEIQIITSCQSSKEGLQAIKKLQPDLVFLDIEMPWMNGFELLEILGDINFDIIFTTAYDEFAVQAFRISAVDYLLKPIDKDDLISAVQKVKDKRDKSVFSNKHLKVLMENMKPTSNIKRIALPTFDGFDLVLIQDIEYCEADGSYSYVYLINGKKMMVSRTMKDLTELLSEFNFCRIHHSFLINLDHTAKFSRADGGYVLMANGKRLSVSRAKKDDLLRRIKG